MIFLLAQYAILSFPLTHLKFYFECIIAVAVAVIVTVAVEAAGSVVDPILLVYAVGRYWYHYDYQSLSIIYLN